MSVSVEAEPLDGADHWAEARRYRKEARKWWLVAGVLLVAAAVIDLVRGNDEEPAARRGRS